MIEKYGSLIGGLSVGLFILLSSVFLALLYFSSAGDALQALGNLLGAAIGTVGAFAVAYWTLHKERQEKKLTAEHSKKLIETDLYQLVPAVMFPLMSLMHADAPDGRLPSSFFRGIYKPDRLVRHKSSNFNIAHLTPDQINKIEYLEQIIDRYLERVDIASNSEDPVPDRTQSDVWGQLAHLKDQLWSTLDLVIDGRPSISVDQLKSFNLQEYAPHPGKAFDPSRVYELIAGQNRMASAFAKANPPQQS